MAAQPQPTPLEVYLSSTFEPDAEFVHGVIEERPTGEWNQANWQAAILEFFRTRRIEWNIRAAAELRVQISADQFRVPDVTVLDRSHPVEQIVTHPPIAVFEILSPEDTLARMMIKLGDYEAMGIQTILLLDPQGKHFRYRNGCLEPLAETAFDLPGSVCRFDLDEIQKLLD
ncbi:Uma2 family endonuclease [Occallatibacter riparius]|uniref:Uma2 family endonuclease n=1 Tax=Occallatibacter riparius TaxID=1002689 RepID=A0A9J7BYF5_9BACT|nr:Uma2 family endonuclease [Occallatibacter riparius]UWZ86461.1 Uma2 family endonuclease [Occallatibacter riparius]